MRLFKITHTNTIKPRQPPKISQL